MPRAMPWGFTKFFITRAGGPQMSELSVEEITKDYPTRAEDLRVLRGVSLKLAESENLAILGPSGSGKSTLLYIIGTLERPTSGTIRLDEDDPFQLSEPKLADFRSRRIGFVFQDHHLLPQCSVLENVLLPTLADGSGNPATVSRARMLLERVGLGERLEHRPAESLRRRTAARGSGQSTDPPAIATFGGRADRQSRPNHGRRCRPALAGASATGEDDAHRRDA